GDARGATIRLLDRAGDELARADGDAQASGTSFRVTASARGPVLARVRAAAVRAHDATRLSSAEVVAAIACPGDVSLGDALCAVGELVDAVSVLPGRRARRLERTAEAVTVALVRAGEATDSGQTVRARHALKVAQLRLGKLVHLAAARSL